MNENVENNSKNHLKQSITTGKIQEDENRVFVNLIFSGNSCNLAGFSGNP